MTTKPARKKLSLVKATKTSDNKVQDVDLTFTVESKQALESAPDATQELVRRMKANTLKFISEIQKLGDASGLDIRVRPIFDMKQKGV